MYVIFPADEVVYLSYGRLIYVPLSPSDARTHVPIRTTSLEATERELSNAQVPSTSSEPAKGKKTNPGEPLSPKPGPSSVGFFDRSKNREKKPEQNGCKANKTKSVPQKSSPALTGSLERPPKTPERAFNSNSNKSSKSSKHSTSSSKSRSQPSGSREKVEVDAAPQPPIRDRTSSDSANPPKTNKFRSSSFRSFLRPSLNREKTPEAPPVRPERKKEKKASKQARPKSPVAEKRPSFSDLSVVIPRSEIINTRSDQIQTPRVERPVPKREKSPVIRFFRAKSASPRNSPRGRHSVDFDYLFSRDPSPGKLSVHSVPQLKQGESSGVNLASQQNSPSSVVTYKEKGVLQQPKNKRSQNGRK